MYLDSLEARLRAGVDTETEWPPPQSPDEVEMAFYEKFFLSKGFEPYPVQEEAFDKIFAGENLLVTVPTGTGKTMIAKAGLMKALYTQKRAIFTTPLRALTEEKYRELCEDFGSEYVGFATGDYKINPKAPIQVMVAEIVWNMIFSGGGHIPADIIIMDEGHYFNDPERGYVWEQSIIGLHKDAQLVILSATVGNPQAFCQWTYLVRGAPMGLVISNERKVPLIHKYEENYLIEEVRELNAKGDVPAVIFVFGRRQCFEYARLLKSCRRFTTEEEQKEIEERAKRVLIPRGSFDLLMPLLTHGIGIHHAGILPSYKQLIEELTLDRLLKFVVSTETISAGINLPAKRVVFPSLRKHIRKQSRLLLPAEYHQMAGRAGRPQFDKEGIAISLAPEEVVQEYRKELSQAQRSGRHFDAEKLRKKIYSRARTEAQRRDDISWGPDEHKELVEGQPAALKSHTKISAEQILAIGLPDLEQEELPGVALVEAEKQAEAKKQAERDARIQAQQKKREEREKGQEEGETPKKKKGFQIGGQLAGLGALLAQVKDQQEEEPEEAEAPKEPNTPEEQEEANAKEPETTEAEASGEAEEALDPSAIAPLEVPPISDDPWPSWLPKQDVLTERLKALEEPTPWPKDKPLPPPMASRRHGYRISRFNIKTIIDKLFISDQEKRDAHKLLVKITNNLKALDVIDEKGRQRRGWLIGKLRGIDGPFTYYCLMHYDLSYTQARELVETLVDHDVIHRLLHRKEEDEKREWMRARLRERRMENPLTTWDDVEAEYERKFPRKRSFIEQVHDTFIKKVPHPELHTRLRFKEVWAKIEDEQHSIMDFVERHKLEQEEGSLFSYLSRILKTAKMLYEASYIEVFRTLELRVRSKLSMVDDRILDELWYTRLPYTPPEKPKPTEEGEEGIEGESEGEGDTTEASAAEDTAPNTSTPEAPKEAEGTEEPKASEASEASESAPKEGAPLAAEGVDS